MADLVAGTIGRQNHDVEEAPENLPPAKADANQLEVALLNLLVDARDAMPDRGTLRILATAETVERRGGRAGLMLGSYTWLSVADPGIGMDTTTLARAVEPFSSTKEVGQGAGLGLFMIHGFSSQLGAALTVQNRSGLGTNVEL